MSSASRGLAPCEGLGLLLLKLGRTGPLAEPCHGPQVGKSRYPRSQNTDNDVQNVFEVPVLSRKAWHTELSSSHQIKLARRS